jgi:hypothetical protein
MSESEKTLPNLIREITFFYVKHYYDKYLTQHNITTMDDIHINSFITQHYTNKEKELRDYIRNTLKKNQGISYNSIAVENILLEISSDPTMAKERIKLEIQDFQNNKG